MVEMASTYEDDITDSNSEEEFHPSNKSYSNRRKNDQKAVTIKLPTSKSPRRIPKGIKSPRRSKKSGTISTFASRKSMQDLWQNKKMKTGSTKKSSGAVEAWSDHLRRSGSGISTESKRATMTGLSKSQTKDLSYASTSHYLRQLMGTEKNRKAEMNGIGRPAPGTPAYKSQEEYYDEIIELKKQIGNMSNDSSAMKSKIRRLEEDNLKKEKEIQGLLDPTKSDEIRRTLTDRKPDSSAVIHSLKQKILKLEHNLKDKEAQYSKLQSDLKTTRVEEMKLQLETCYKEILRMSTTKNAGALSARNSAREEKSMGPKLKALQETVLRMNEKNVRLQQENKTLKEDLEKLMDENSQNKARNVEYEDMSKKQLMSALTKLEKRLDKADADSSSLMSDLDDRRLNSKTEGKLSLEGTMAQKLNQLDKRESELLEECNKQRGIIKKLKDDRAHYRKKTEEKDKEMKQLKRDVEELQTELDEFYNKDRSAATPRTASRRSSVRTTSPAMSRAGSRSRSPSVASEVSRKSDREIEKMRENNAAKKIQRGWRSHRNHQEDEAAEVIQSAMRGHLSRKRNLSYLKDRSRGYHAEMQSEESETELDSAAEYIQSNVRGYRYHKEHINRRSPSLSGRSNNSRSRLDSAGEEEDDEIAYYSQHERRSSSGRSPSRNSHRGISPHESRGKSPHSSIKGRSPSTFSNRSYSNQTPTRSHYGDDNDDIVDSRRMSHGKYYK